MNKIETIKEKIQVLNNKMESLLKEIKDTLPKEDLDINVSKSWDGYRITITDPKTMWSREYYTITFEEGNFKLNHGTGGWNDVTATEQIETILKISKVLEFIKDNKDKLINFEKELNVVDDKILELKAELKITSREEYTKELIDNGYKLYSEDEIKKLLKNNLDKELDVEIGDSYNKVKENVKLLTTKENNRYKVYLNDGRFSINDFVKYYSNYFIKGL